MAKCRTELTKNPKTKPADQSKLGFGQIFTDHMFIMNYKAGKGWYDPRIVPYATIELDPAAMILHYGQEVFEGMKAYKAKDGRVLLFRPEENFKRLNLSNDRLCIPLLNVDDCVDYIKQFVEVEKDWIPTEDGTSLYLRPFVIATDAHLGVRAANEYLYMVIASPVGAYYPEGLNPVKIYVETKYCRAVAGGTGFTKTGGNYAASLKAQYEAKLKEYSQVLWLDAVERKYIEEVGTMNVFFKIDGKIITPELNGSILGGITRKSVIEILKSWGYEVQERRISINEVYEAYNSGKLEEVFGTGTAAVISPVGHLNWGDEKIMDINNNEIGELSQKLYDCLTGIQWGKIKDEFNYTSEV